MTPRQFSLGVFLLVAACLFQVQEHRTALFVGNGGYGVRGDGANSLILAERLRGRSVCSDAAAVMTLLHFADLPPGPSFSPKALGSVITNSESSVTTKSAVRLT